MRKNSKKWLSLALALVMALGMLPAGARAAETPEDAGPVWAKMVSAGSEHSLAVKTNGSLWAWGNNSEGQMGDGTTADYLRPVKIMDDVQSVSAGLHNSFAVKRDGSLWAWGSGTFGLGDGTTTEYLSPPKKIMDDVTALSSSEVHILAIKSDGSLWTWGTNYFGELGDGSTTNRNTPVKIMDDVMSVSAGSHHSTAIKRDGSLWAWGNNSWGELGDGSTTDRHSPVKIMDDVMSVSGGDNHTLAIKTDGSLWAWGRNRQGELGDGSTTDQHSPVKVMDNVAAISANSHSMAIKTDGSLWAWGCNVHGQLGDGTVNPSVLHKGIPPRSIPVKVMEDVEAVSAGGNYTLAVKKDHNLWAWGQGAHGRLGDGTTEDHYSPVKIMSLLDVDTIAEETILRAKLLATDHSFAFYREWESPIQIMAKQLDPYASATWYTVENLLETFYKSFTTQTAPGNVSAVEFYEYLLLRLMDSEDQDFLAVSEPYGMLKDYAGVDINSVMLEKLASAGMEITMEITEDNKGMLKDVCEAICGTGDFADVGWLDSLLVTGKTMDTFATEVIKAYALISISDARAEVAKMIGEHAQADALKIAADNVYTSIQRAKEEGISYCLTRGSDAAIDEIAVWFLGRVADDLFKLSPNAEPLKKAIEAGTLEMDAIFQTNDIATDTIRILAMANVERALLSVIDDTEEAFLNSNKLEDAQQLLTLADTLKQELLVGCDLVLNLIDHTERGALNWHGIDNQLSMVKEMKADVGALIKWVFGDPDSEYAQLRKSVTNIKKTIQNANFYAGSVSVLELLRENQSKTPSTWAEGEVSKAINYGFLPSVMQNNYQANITRIEFCALLEYMIESKTGKTALELADELAEEQGGYIKPPFDDALYMEVNDIARLGIITGVGNNMFSPLGEITRQEAATMLYRTANVLGYDISAGQTGYSGVASWASEGVDFVSDRGIMNGTDNGFDPVGKYTKEQAILTMVRFYENVK